MTGEQSTPDPKQICLDQFLKLCSLAVTGGHAKFMIQGGEVRVNGVTETRRRRKLVDGDVVEVGGEQLTVQSVEGQESD